MAVPETRDAQLAVIQESIDRRRQGGISPQIQQQTGAAGGPVTEGTPQIDPSTVLAQRAGAPTGAAPEAAAPTTGEDSPEETKIVMQLLLKKLQTLLKTGTSTGAA